MVFCGHHELYEFSIALWQWYMYTFCLQCRQWFNKDHVPRWVVRANLVITSWCVCTLPDAPTMPTLLNRRERLNLNCQLQWVTIFLRPAHSIQYTLTTRNIQKIHVRPRFDVDNKTWSLHRDPALFGLISTFAQPEITNSPNPSAPSNSIPSGFLDVGASERKNERKTSFEIASQKFWNR